VLCLERFFIVSFFAPGLDEPEFRARKVI
jgi:hypothetical protein